MCVDEWRPLQDNANLIQLELAGGYYSDLRGRIIIRKDDMKVLKLKDHMEIAITINGSEWNGDEMDESPPVFVSAVVTSISIEKGRNLWVNFADGAKYIDYLNITVKFREFDVTGNLLMVKEHARGTELAVGDTIFLKVQRVLSSPQ